MAFLAATDGDVFYAASGANLFDTHGKFVDDGCAVHQSGGMIVSVQSGTVFFNNTRLQFTGVQQTIETSHPTLNRRDLISINSAGTVTYTSGAAAVSPNTPTVPYNNVVLAVVQVSGGVTSIINRNVVDVRPAPYPSIGIDGRYPIHGSAYKSIVAGTWAFFTLGSIQQTLMTAFWNGTAPAIGDKIRYHLYLPRGIYTFNLHPGRKLADHGILKLSIDDVNVGSIDLYAVSATYGTTETIPNIKITQSKEYQVDCWVNTKNASSTDYIIPIAQMWFQRTGN